MSIRGEHENTFFCNFNCPLDVQRDGHNNEIDLISDGSGYYFYRPIVVDGVQLFV